MSRVGNDRSLGKLVAVVALQYEGKTVVVILAVTTLRGISFVPILARAFPHRGVATLVVAGLVVVVLVVLLSFLLELVVDFPHFCP